MPLLQPHWRPPAPPRALAAPRVVEQAPHQGRLAPSMKPWISLGDPQAPFSLPAPRWPVECEVIQETIEHIGEGMLQLSPPPHPCARPLLFVWHLSLCHPLPEWVPPKPEPFCPPMGPEQPMYTLSEEQGTTVYHCPGNRAQAAPLSASALPRPTPLSLLPHSTPSLLLYPCSGWGGPRATLLASSPLGGSAGHHAALRVPL